MPSTALRPKRRKHRDAQKQTIHLIIKTLSMTQGNETLSSCLVILTPTLYEVLCELARVWNGEPPAACVPHSQDT